MHLPVPPAISPTDLAVLISAGVFFSGWIAKFPETAAEGGTALDPGFKKRSN